MLVCSEVDGLFDVAVENKNKQYHQWQIRMTLKKKSKRLTTDGSLKHVQRV